MILRSKPHPRHPSADVSVMRALVAMYRLQALAGARLRRGDAGATATEYALLAALVAGVIILAVATVGGEVLGLFQSADDALDVG